MIHLPAAPPAAGKNAESALARGAHAFELTLFQTPLPGHTSTRTRQTTGQNDHRSTQVSGPRTRETPAIAIRMESGLVRWTAGTFSFVSQCTPAVPPACSSMFSVVLLTVRLLGGALEGRRGHQGHDQENDARHRVSRRAGRRRRCCRANEREWPEGASQTAETTRSPRTRTNSKWGQTHSHGQSEWEMLVRSCSRVSCLLLCCLAPSSCSRRLTR